MDYKSYTYNTLLKYIQDTYSAQTKDLTLEYLDNLLLECGSDDIEYLKQKINYQFERR